MKGSPTNKLQSSTNGTFIDIINSAEVSTTEEGHVADSEASSSEAAHGLPHASSSSTSVPEVIPQKCAPVFAVVAAMRVCCTFCIVAETAVARYFLRQRIMHLRRWVGLQSATDEVMKALRTGA